MSGCTSCGILYYCSKTCWRAHLDVHEQGGECALLRGLYPRLMAEYYTMGVGSCSASAGDGGCGGACSTVVMPGDEALYWAQSTGEPRMLEFQSLLFSAIVVAHMRRAGHQTHCAAAADDATAPVVAALCCQVWFSFDRS
ncbi:hypothetical protein NXY56_003129 [Leishmania guyanensis]